MQYSAPLAESDCLGYERGVGKSKRHTYLQINYAPIRIFFSEFVTITNTDLIIVNRRKELNNSFSLQSGFVPENSQLLQSNSGGVIQRKTQGGRKAIWTEYGIASQSGRIYGLGAA